MSLEDEVDELLELLAADDFPPGVLDVVNDRFSDACKDALVARIARTVEPPPDAALLARLPFILTDQNRDDMITALLLNHRSPHPEARRASLYSLEVLEYPGMSDVALSSLRDPEDRVLSAACDILLRHRSDQPHLRAILDAIYEGNKGRDDLFTTLNLLRTNLAKDDEA